MSDPVFFTEADIARLSRSSVPQATLARLDLATGPMRLFAGVGMLDAAGFEWRGMGEMIGIEGLTDGRGTSAQEVIITIPNVPKDALRSAFLTSHEVLDRLITIFILLMDDDRQPIGMPLTIFRGLMKRPKITHSEMSDDEGPKRNIALPCEGFMLGRARPSYGRCTHSDQQARFPGDLFFQFTYKLKNTTITFPDY